MTGLDGLEPWAGQALLDARHGVLVTIDGRGRPRPVPFTFVLAGDRLVSAVDHKPKSTRWLARLDDIVARGWAAAIVEHYDDDWSRLWWVRLAGPARVLPDSDGPEVNRALAVKYPQYREQPPAGPWFEVVVEEASAWRAAGPGKELALDN